MELKYERCVVNVFCFHLLIVLNGIEIKPGGGKELHGQRLLIVLNGIEIVQLQDGVRGGRPFNRTKWNWNGKSGVRYFFPPLLLIVLNGIEMVLCLLFDVCPLFLLIVLNGIEILRLLHWSRFLRLLLIVLNGIEIVLSICCIRFCFAFNRTKWNWNLMDIDPEENIQDF